MTARQAGPPPVIAPPGDTPCGEVFASLGGTRCERPAGHEGGHLSQARGHYWPSETAATSEPVRMLCATRSAARPRPSRAT